ncbi:hypothetical protein ACFU53_22030 [Streptomyces sp. NPDC057474]|uniref:hypothetical protein n=1 Tax=Streptomyces sp. NPDC057474 TaxID=3346144 RepID=UPI00368BC41F
MPSREVLDGCPNVTTEVTLAHPHGRPVPCTVGDLFRPGFGTGMKLAPNAAPGVEQYAETAVESACHLAGINGPESWNAAAADDGLDTIDVLADALSVLGPDIAAALAPVRAATVDARRRLGLPTAREETVVTTGFPGHRYRRLTTGRQRRWPGCGDHLAAPGQQRFPG